MQEGELKLFYNPTVSLQCAFSKQRNWVFEEMHTLMFTKTPMHKNTRNGQNTKWDDKEDTCRTDSTEDHYVK